MIPRICEMTMADCVFPANFSPVETGRSRRDEKVKF